LTTRLADEEAVRAVVYDQNFNFVKDFFQDSHRLLIVDTRTQTHYLLFLTQHVLTSFALMPTSSTKRIYCAVIYKLYIYIYIYIGS